MCQLHALNCCRVFDSPSSTSYATAACASPSASTAASSPPGSCLVPAGESSADALEAARGADRGGGRPGGGEADGGNGGGRGEHGGLVATLVQAMVKHVRDVHAVTGACSVVWALAWRDDARAARLAAGGAVGAILRAMRVAGDSDALSNELQGAAAGALWALALSEKGLEVMLASDEAQETLEQATILHPAAQRCQHFGRLLLGVLCD